MHWDLLHAPGRSAFLAHLSEMLMGELIVYEGIWRLSDVRPSVVNIFKQLLL